MPEADIDYKSRKLFFDSLKKLEQRELEDFILSLLSGSEIKDISRRLMVAKSLKSGNTYDEIVDIMGMSESTIGKIHAKTHGSPIINKLFTKD